MLDLDEAQAVILDVGSSAIKAGFAGDSEPRAVVPTTVLIGSKGVAERGKGWQGPPYVAATDVEIAELLREGERCLKSPVERGAIVNWEEFEQVLHRTLEEVQAPTTGSAILVTEPPFSSITQREQMVQLLFEEFGASSVSITLSGAMSLYSTGNRTGLVVEVGDGVSQMVPIFEEFVVPHAVRRADLGGRDLTQQLERLLYQERGYKVASSSSKFALRSAKEQLCYVAQQYKAEASAAEGRNGDLERTFQLPDGTGVLSMGSERFRCPEALFKPSMLGVESPGLHELAFQALTKCDVDVQRGLASNIVLTGGSVQFEGLRERLRRELMAMAPPSLLMKLEMPQTPRDAAFMGSSILACVGEVQKRWMTHREYEEKGASAIHPRCLSLTDPIGRTGTL